MGINADHCQLKGWRAERLSDFDRDDGYYVYETTSGNRSSSSCYNIYISFIFYDKVFFQRSVKAGVKTCTAVLTTGGLNLCPPSGCKAEALTTLPPCCLRHKINKQIKKNNNNNNNRKHQQQKKIVSESTIFRSCGTMTSHHHLFTINLLRLRLIWKSPDLGYGRKC